MKTVRSASPSPSGSRVRVRARVLRGVAAYPRLRAAQEGRRYAICGNAMAVCIAIAALFTTRSSGADDAVTRAERQRMAMVAEVSPSVVCIYDEMERGGGSGVLIDEGGNGLTNYHVIAGMLEKRRGLGGLSDGNVYELEVLGIDPTGDVAMFHLKGRENFPFARLGDSNAVRLGDAVIAMGNPFVLSEDQTPTVTTGIVTGLHRYQGGTGQNLVYSDCIQTDASINPGNSGGPLFNKAGEVIGINGRISVNTRGRFNVGFGYAIASNQIRRFIPTLRAGLLARHGTLQATVEQVGVRDLRFGTVRPGFAADRAGIRAGDRLYSVDCLQFESVNEYTGLIGTYPENWPITLNIEHEGVAKELQIRLDPVEPKLGKPFVPDPEINKREVRRVIDRYRKLQKAGADESGSDDLPVKTVRHRIRIGEEKTPSITRVSNLWDVVAPVEMWDESPGGIRRGGFRFDDDEVRARSVTDGSEYEPLMEDSLALAAMYVLHRRLPGDEDLTRRDGVRHTGTGAVSLDGECRKRHGRGPLSAMPVELVVYPVLNRAEIELAFDLDTGNLWRAIARDRASGVEVVMEPGGAVHVSGRRMPTHFSVRGPTNTYEERFEIVTGEP